MYSYGGSQYSFKVCKRAEGSAMKWQEQTVERSLIALLKSLNHKLLPGITTLVLSNSTCVVQVRLLSVGKYVTPQLEI